MSGPVRNQNFPFKYRSSRALLMEARRALRQEKTRRTHLRNCHNFLYQIDNLATSLSLIHFSHANLLLCGVRFWSGSGGEQGSIITVLESAAPKSAPKSAGPKEPDSLSSSFTRMLVARSRRWKRSVVRSAGGSTAEDRRRTLREVKAPQNLMVPDA